MIRRRSISGNEDANANEKKLNEGRCPVDCAIKRGAAWGRLWQ